MARITPIKAADDRSAGGAANLVASIGATDPSRVRRGFRQSISSAPPNAPTKARSAAVGAFMRWDFIRIIRAIRGQKPAFAALEQHARRTQVAEHGGRLAEVAQAAAQPQPVAAFNYARDIRAGLRQKTLHAAAMMRSCFRFHPSTAESTRRWLTQRSRMGDPRSVCQLFGRFRRRGGTETREFKIARSIVEA